MRTPRIYVDAALETGAAIGLPPSQSHYVRNVLRTREGQPIVLFNGLGGEFVGQVVSVQRAVVTVRLDEFVSDDRESPLEIHLGLAITKRDAMDTAMQKATELGVKSITPLISAFTATSRKALEKRVQHWHGVIRSAAEQCERNRLPVLNPVSGIQAFIEGVDADLRLIAHPGERNPLNDDNRPSTIALLVGPEGGFSDDELLQSVTAGFQPMGLGPRILRADTAPLVMISLLQARWGDLLSAPGAEAEHVGD